jgi:hypothetical protein
MRMHHRRVVLKNPRIEEMEERWGRRMKMGKVVAMTTAAMVVG